MQSTIDDQKLVLRVKFYQTDSGKESVRDWLKSLTPELRQIIGEDIKSVQFGWLLGMSLVRKLAPNLWEVRCFLPQGIARILFTVVGHYMVLLHGLIKKLQKLPLTKSALATKMHTSRAAVNRLLDPTNASVTLQTLERAALALANGLKSNWYKFLPFQLPE